MKRYYVNIKAGSTGEHEVHTDKCVYFKTMTNCKYLGLFSSCDEAILEAEKEFEKVDGCYYCCYSCHKK